MLKSRLVKIFVIIMLLIVAAAFCLAAMSVLKFLPIFGQTQESDPISFVDGEPLTMIFVVTAPNSDGVLMVKSGEVLYGTLMEPLTIIAYTLDVEGTDFGNRSFTTERDIIKYIRRTYDIPDSHFILVNEKFVDNFNSLYENHKKTTDETQNINFCGILQTLTDEDLILLGDQFSSNGNSDLRFDDLLVLWTQLKSKPNCFYETAGN